jgi:hypothetical protein
MKDTGLHLPAMVDRAAATGHRSDGCGRERGGQLRDIRRKPGGVG